MLTLQVFRCQQSGEVMKLRTNQDASPTYRSSYWWRGLGASPSPPRTEFIVGFLFAYGFSWQVGQARYSLDWLWTCITLLSWDLVERSDLETSLGYMIMMTELTLEVWCLYLTSFWIPHFNFKSERMTLSLSFDCYLFLCMTSGGRGLSCKF